MGYAVVYLRYSSGWKILLRNNSYYILHPTYILHILHTTYYIHTTYILHTTYYILHTYYIYTTYYILHTTYILHTYYILRTTYCWDIIVGKLSAPGSQNSSHLLRRVKWRDAICHNVISILNLFWTIISEPRKIKPKIYSSVGRVWLGNLILSMTFWVSFCNNVFAKMFWGKPFFASLEFAPLELRADNSLHILSVLLNVINKGIYFYLLISHHNKHYLFYQINKNWLRCVNVTHTSGLVLAS